MSVTLLYPSFGNCNANLAMLFQMTFPKLTIIFIVDIGVVHVILAQSE